MNGNDGTNVGIGRREEVGEGGVEEGREEGRGVWRDSVGEGGAEEGREEGRGVWRDSVGREVLRKVGRRRCVEGFSGGGGVEEGREEGRGGVEEERE